MKFVLIKICFFLLLREWKWWEKFKEPDFLVANFNNPTKLSANLIVSNARDFDLAKPIHLNTKFV